MLIRSQSKEVLIDITGKRLKIVHGKYAYHIETQDSISAVILGYYGTKEIAQQVLDGIEIAWSKWTPGSPAYHISEDNGVSDMSDVEKPKLYRKVKL